MGGWCVCVCVFIAKETIVLTQLGAGPGLRRESQKIALVLFFFFWCWYPKNQLLRSFRILDCFLAWILIDLSDYQYLHGSWIPTGCKVLTAESSRIRTQCCVVAPSAFCPKPASYLGLKVAMSTRLGGVQLSLLMGITWYNYGNNSFKLGYNPKKMWLHTHL